MNKEWTFANLEGNWVYDSFPTKQEAIQAGKMEFEETYLVGQLHGNDEKLLYMVENIEEINN